MGTVLGSLVLLAAASALLPVMGQGPGRTPQGPKTVRGQKQLMSAKEEGGLVSWRQGLDALMPNALHDS